MGNMTITDGRTGSPHITAAEVWAANVGIWGPGDRLLSTGQNMRAQIINNNTVRIYDGVVSLQGLRCGIPYGQYIDITIQNGTTGQKRRDAIYIEYTYNPTLRTMDTDLKVKKGVAGTSYVSPTLQTGDIAGGALTHQGLLCHVDIDGLTISKTEIKMQPPELGVDYPITDTELKSLYGNTATMKSILQALGVDYIVEKYKTAEGWTVEKWASGKLDQWTRKNVSGPINSSTSIGGYLGDIQTLVAPVVSVATPYLSYNISRSSDDITLAVRSIGFLKKTTVKLRAHAAAAQTNAAYALHVRILGTWE